MNIRNLPALDDRHDDDVDLIAEFARDSRGKPPWYRFSQWVDIGSAEGDAAERLAADGLVILGRADPDNNVVRIHIRKRQASR